MGSFSHWLRLVDLNQPQRNQDCIIQGDSSYWSQTQSKQYKRKPEIPPNQSALNWLTHYYLHLHLQDPPPFFLLAKKGMLLYGCHIQVHGVILT